MLKLVAILGVALTGIGCASARTAAVGHAGFYHRTQPLFIAYDQVGTRTILSGGWHAENFIHDEGLPDEMKIGPSYLTRYDIDRRGDGFYKPSDKVTLNDLVLEHAKHDGVIWLRAFPVSDTDAEKDPEVMLRRWVRVFSGPSITISTAKGRVTARSTHLIAEPPSIDSCKMAGRSAAHATVTFALVDQVQIAPQARARRIELILVRTGFQWKVDRRTGVPSWLLIGYSNSEADFERGQPDFHRLVKRIALGGVDVEPNGSGTGFRRGFVCEESLAAVPSAAAAAPALPPTQPPTAIPEATSAETDAESPAAP